MTSTIRWLLVIAAIISILLYSLFVPPPTIAAQCGIASWYGPGFDGRRTASREVFDQSAMTAAHRTLPFGTVVTVTHQRTGKKVRVRINDRGPFHKGRVIDLSKAAASRLGIIRAGTGRVCVST